MPSPAKTPPASFPMLAGEIEMATFDIPGDCTCTWSVSKPGPGRQCMSTLRFRNAMCFARHERKAVSGRG